MMNFPSIFPLLPFLLLLLFHRPTTAATTHDLVDPTCKQASQGDPNINYTFCFNALESIPASHHANLPSLGLISIKLVKSNVTYTKSMIKSLMQNNNNVDKNTKAGLKDCLDLYSDALSTLSEATNDYSTNHFGDANIKVSSVMDASTTCQQGFEDFRVVSPLKTQNDNVFQLSAITLSIMNMLH